MLCKKPYMQGIQALGCGQCMPCRLNRRRIWTHRMVLESLKHPESSFISLTYDDEHLPAGGTLVPKHTQDFLKRLRKYLAPKKVRYFLCGEYGDQTQRPHYHIALFGYPACPYGNYNGCKLSYCEVCSTIKNIWGQGFVTVGALERKSAQYIAGYVTKKMTSKNDLRLNGRHPEFARMSLRPGIGATALEEILESLTTQNGADYLIKNKDIPNVLRHGSTVLPLGRYLRMKLREGYGFKETGTPKEVLRDLALQRLQELSGMSKDDRQAEKAQAKQKVLNMENKAKIFAKKGNI